MSTIIDPRYSFTFDEIHSASEQKKIVAIIRRLYDAERALAEERALADSVATALRDALSTFRDDDKTTLITAGRKEAWAQVLAEYDKRR